MHLSFLCLYVFTKFSVRVELRGPSPIDRPFSDTSAAHNLDAYATRR